MAKNCTYTIKGNSAMTNVSYSDILDHIDRLLAEKGDSLFGNTILGIVYSKELQESLFNKLEALREDSLTHKTTGPATLEDILSGGAMSYNEGKSITEFLNTPEASINGISLVSTLDLENYRKFRQEYIKTELGVTDEEAATIVLNELDHFDILKKNAAGFHKLFTSVGAISKDFDRFHELIGNLKSLGDLVSDFATTALEEKFLGQLNQRHNFTKGGFSNYKVKYRVGLNSTLKDGATKLYSMVDEIIVDSDGKLHVYMYKAFTNESWRKAPDVKKQLYKQEMAFISAMLNNNGFDTTNIELNIIPVIFKYNDDYSLILDVYVANPETVSTGPYGYALTQLDRKAKHFIETSKPISVISTSAVLGARQYIDILYPSLNIRNDGFEKSVQAWINSAPAEDPAGIQPLVIKYSTDPDYSWDVIINGTVHKIANKKPKEINPEITQLIREHVNELEENKGYLVSRLASHIRDMYAKNKQPNFEHTPGLRYYAAELRIILNKYFESSEDSEGNVHFKYELLDTIDNANVLIFLNKETKVLDFVSLSTYSLDTSPNLAYGSNLFGDYKLNSLYVKMNGDYGNIQALSTLLFINEAARSFSDYHLGLINVISLTGSVRNRRINISEFHKKVFPIALEVINKTLNDESLHLRNNLSDGQFEDPVKELLREYLAITSSKSQKDVTEIDELGFDILQGATTREQTAGALLLIMTQILQEYPNFSNYETLKRTLSLRGNSRSVEYAQLFKIVSRAYFYVTGNSPVIKNHIDEFDLQAFTAPTVPDENIRYIVNNLQITHDTIASEFLNIYEKDIRNQFDTYYKEYGYSHFRNMTFGDLVNTFRNLFRYDNNGVNTFEFKNPYDLTEDLSDAERKLLKHVLYQIALINSEGTFQYQFSDEANIAKYIENNSHYLWVPLERASKATSLSKLSGFKSKLKNAFKVLAHPDETYDDFILHISKFERNWEAENEHDTSFDTLRLRNKFSSSIPKLGNWVNVLTNRSRLLQLYGADFFETNVENILIDFLGESIKTKLLGKLLTISKAFMTLMRLTGDMGGNEEVILKELNYILDYLKINVFHQTIMSPTSKRIISVVLPVKSVVTDLLLGGNVVSCLRDTFEGLELNFVRSLLKINTDISAKNLKAAYAYVMKNSTSDHMKINLLSKLCLKYRLSNTDVGRITERAKSARNGLLNYDNWLYSTLRSPDFLNRMTLFVARCMLDGVWDAWYIDDNNQLKYDWKKDKRFSLLSDSSKSNTDEYKKLLSLKYSKTRQYNLDNPENQISLKDDLPWPYSDTEVNNIRNLADNIYGSYDKGKKSMYENWAIGITAGMFTTWLNGILNNYYMKPLENGVTRFKLELAKDERGNLLYFTEDGQITNENTGLIVWDNVPIPVQGILQTIGDLYKINLNNGLNAAWDFMKADPVARDNMKKLASDLIMFAFLSALFAWLRKYYLDYKKTDMKDNPFLVNAVIEIVYKASSRSFDSFGGFIPLLQRSGDLSTPWYEVPTDLLSQAAEVAFGDKKVESFIFNTSGLFRSIGDSGRAVAKQMRE